MCATFITKHYRMLKLTRVNTSVLLHLVHVKGVSWLVKPVAMGYCHYDNVATDISANRADAGSTGLACRPP